jgi:hypothetical protein
MLRKDCLTLGFLVQVKSVSSLMQVPLPAIILWLLIDHLSFFTTGKLVIGTQCCGSWIRIFPSRIRIKEFKYF